MSLSAEASNITIIHDGVITHHASCKVGADTGMHLPVNCVEDREAD